MENASFETDEPSGSTDIVEENKPRKKKSSVAFSVEDEEVVTNGPVVTITPVTRTPPIIIIPSAQTQLNLSPLMDLFGNSLSFHLTTKYLACCPHMTLTPIQFETSTTEPATSLDGTAVSTTSSGYEIQCRAQKYVNWCLCCCMSRINSQVVSISKRGNSEGALSFIYTPHIWCPAPANEDRPVDIFLSGMAERMGWIDAGRDVGLGSEINCGLTKEVFITRQVHEKGSPRSFKIENSAGLEVANGKVTTSALMSGLGFHHWTGYQLNFVPSEVDTLPQPTRAVLLVAFLLWVIDARERRQWTYIWTVLIALFFLMCFLLIHFFGPD